MRSARRVPVRRRRSAVWHSGVRVCINIEHRAPITLCAVPKLRRRYQQTSQASWYVDAHSEIHVIKFNDLPREYGIEPPKRHLP